MDDMTIKSAGLSSVGDLAGASSATSPMGGSHAGGSFLGSLKDAIAQVNEVQLDATQAVDKFVGGESDNVHHMMMALQKADVSFQLMMQVRNKLVSAYEDIQRMQM
jgi:flagellar hook-basal body complex protein FliE